jgi:hypothetical protein
MNGSGTHRHGPGPHRAPGPGTHAKDPMRDEHNIGEHQTGDSTATPSACPACQSGDLTTTSKVVNLETYWRCVTCGEVWNVRRREASRYPTCRQFRRVHAK